MPVRSLNSSVLKWPDLHIVHQAVAAWSKEQCRLRREILRIGYFGSYARGDWGVSSDLDLILIVEQSGQPFWQRSLEWDVTRLPVPVDLLVYTQDEWLYMVEEDRRFAREVEAEAVWVYRADREVR